MKVSKLECPGCGGKEYLVTRVKDKVEEKFFIREDGTVEGEGHWSLQSPAWQHLPAGWYATCDRGYETRCRYWTRILGIPTDLEPKQALEKWVKNDES